MQRQPGGLANAGQYMWDHSTQWTLVGQAPILEAEGAALSKGAYLLGGEGKSNNVELAFT